MEGSKLFWVRRIHTNHAINGDVPQGSILGHTHFPSDIIGLPDDVTSIITVYVDKFLPSKCDQVSDLWQQS